MNPNKKIKLPATLSVAVLLSLFSSCASLPAPEVNDSYRYQNSYPSVGLNVSDDKNKTNVAFYRLM